MRRRRDRGGTCAAIEQGSCRIGSCLGALQIVRRHDAIVRDCAADHAGTVLELRGDGFLVSFVRHDDAVACAIAIQRALASDRAEHADGGVHVRIGVHTGEVFMERGRLFGLEVVVPFRLLDCADGEEILVSGRPHDAAPGVLYGPVRELALKGMTGPVLAAPVDWRSAKGIRLTQRVGPHSSAVVG